MKLPNKQLKKSDQEETTMAQSTVNLQKMKSVSSELEKIYAAM